MTRRIRERSRTTAPRAYSPQSHRDTEKNKKLRLSTGQTVVWQGRRRKELVLLCASVVKQVLGSNQSAAFASGSSSWTFPRSSFHISTTRSFTFAVRCA